MKSWVEGNNIETQSAHNEGRSVVAEPFGRTLKKKVYKYITAISKNALVNKLPELIKEYNSTIQRSINMKPADVKPEKQVKLGLPSLCPIRFSFQIFLSNFSKRKKEPSKLSKFKF